MSWICFCKEVNMRKLSCLQAEFCWWQLIHDWPLNVFTAVYDKEHENDELFQVFFFLLNTSPRMRLLSILWNVSMLWWILHTHMDDVIKCVCGCFLSHLNEVMEVKYLQKVSTLSSAWANPVPGVCFFCKPVKQHQLLLHYQKPLLKCFETGHFLPALIAFQSQGQPPHDRSPQWTEYGRLFFLMNV